MEDQVTAWNPIFIKVIFCLYPFVLPSQFTGFHLGQGKVEEGQWMVMESCVNGMRNVWKVYTKGSSAQVRVGAGGLILNCWWENEGYFVFFKLVLQVPPGEVICRGEKKTHSRYSREEEPKQTLGVLGGYWGKVNYNSGESDFTWSLSVQMWLIKKHDLGKA